MMMIGNNINNETNNLLCVGIVNPMMNDKWHQRNQVYSYKGLCPTETATQYKDPPRVLIRY